MATALRISGVVTIILGFVFGLILFSDGYTQALGIASIISGILSGLFLMGMGEIINLLQRLTYESKIAVDKHVLVTNGKGGTHWETPEPTK